MEENEECLVDSFKNVQNMCSLKLKRLSLKSKHNHHHSECDLEHKPETVSPEDVSEENGAIIAESVTEEETLEKKFKKSEDNLSSYSKCYQNNLDLMSNLETSINNAEEFGECSYNEQQKLESDTKSEKVLVGKYGSVIKSGMCLHSKNKDIADVNTNCRKTECETNVSSSPFFHKTKSENQSSIQDAHMLNEGNNNEDTKFSLVIKSENDLVEDCDFPTSLDMCSSAVENIVHRCNCLENNEVCKCPVKRKYKFSSIKRRAGLLYKQIMNSKLNSVNSEYFLLKKNGSSSSALRWIPPRSPYSLIQEDLFDKPWQLLIATIFLTKVSAKKALPQIHKFLKRWPRPEDLLLADEEDLYEYMKPLGLTVTRSHAIMRFTVEFLENDWKYPRELYGIGKYGDDSYRMFCINEWRQVRPDDIPLNLYRNWLLENAETLGIK